MSFSSKVVIALKSSLGVGAAAAPGGFGWLGREVEVPAAKVQKGRDDQQNDYRQDDEVFHGGGGGDPITPAKNRQSNQTVSVVISAWAA